MVKNSPREGEHTVELMDCFHLETEYEGSVRRVHVSELRLADMRRSIPDELWAAIEEAFVVEKIVGHRGGPTKTRMEFEVKWKDYQETTWASYGEIAGTGALKEYARAAGLDL